MKQQSFSTFMTEKRKELGLSLRKAAEIIGLSHSYLDKLEKGDESGDDFTPSPKILKSIARAYEVEYDYLMELCGYIQNDNDTLIRIQHPDILAISRAEKNMTSEQAKNLRKYAEYMYPEAFKDIDQAYEE